MGLKKRDLKKRYDIRSNGGQIQRLRSGIEHPADLLDKNWIRERRDLSTFAKSYVTKGVALTGFPANAIFKNKGITHRRPKKSHGN